MKKTFLAMVLVFLAGSWQIAVGQSNNARDSGNLGSAGVQRITRGTSRIGAAPLLRSI